MSKYALLLLSSLLLSATVSGQDSLVRPHCDAFGCRVDGSHDRLTGPDERRFRPQRGAISTNGLCANGECCSDGQCEVSTGYGAGHCRDGRCEPGRGRDYGRDASSHRDFPYAAERPDIAGTRNQRLENPFRPASREGLRRSRNHREFIPTGFEMRRPTPRGLTWETDIRRAADRAQEAGLPMLIQVSARWCPHCQRMKQETWTNPQLSRLLNDRFVAVSVDADEQRDFVRQMGIQSLPTTLVVAPDLKILDRLQGFQSAGQVLQTLSR